MKHDAMTEMRAAIARRVDGEAYITAMAGFVRGDGVSADTVLDEAVKLGLTPDECGKDLLDVKSNLDTRAHRAILLGDHKTWQDVDAAREVVTKEQQAHYEAMRGVDLELQELEHSWRNARQTETYQKRDRRAWEKRRKAAQPVYDKARELQQKHDSLQQRVGAVKSAEATLREARPTHRAKRVLKAIEAAANDEDTQPPESGTLSKLIATVTG